MELTIKKSTLRLIEAFQSRHHMLKDKMGDSQDAALKGALKRINTYIDDEKAGSTMLETAKDEVYTSFTMKEMFEAAAARPSSDDRTVKYGVDDKLAIAPILAFLKDNKLVDDTATEAKALELAMEVAHDLMDKPAVASRRPDGVIRYRMWR